MNMNFNSNKLLNHLKFRRKKVMLAKRNENYLPSFFDRFWNNELMDWGHSNFSSTNTSLPAVNVKETNDEFIIELAAPGMEKKDFKINFKNNVITISSERENEKEEKRENYTRREFSYQSFQRSFTVPENAVMSDKIGASYNNGILQVTLPKREEVKPQPEREIKIS
jgi:HSP20 family protein